MTYVASTGPVRHTLLAGAEFGRQLTDNFRNTGFFNNTATSILVPFATRRSRTPVTFRQSATDADNHLRHERRGGLRAGSGRAVAARAGGRRAALRPLRPARTTTTATATRSTASDNLVSPRAGVVVKPIAPLSLYGSYSVSYLPSSGDQFSSLTTITQQVEAGEVQQLRGRREVGRRAGAVAHDRRLPAGPHEHALDRSRTIRRASCRPAASAPTATSSGVNGQLTPPWSIAGGYAYQDAFVTSATTAARAGAQVGQVPHHTFSLWNNYQFHPRVGGRRSASSTASDMFADDRQHRDAARLHARRRRASTSR